MAGALSVVAGVAAFGGGIAHAATINYNETSYAGGDFPSSGNPSLGTLGIGVNSISGIINGSGINTGNGDNFTFDTDTFSVILPVGDEITSASWLITGGIFEPTPFSFTTAIGTIDDPLGGLINILSSGTINLTAPYTTAGALDIEAAGSDLCFGASPPTCTFQGFDYTLDYTVAAIPPPPSGVPEPGTFGLVATAIAGAGVFRRKLRR